MIAALGVNGDGCLQCWVEGETKPRSLAAGELDRIASLYARMKRAGVLTLAIHRDALGILGLPARLTPARPGERRPRHAWLDCTFHHERPSHSALAPAIKCGEYEVLIGAYQDGAGDPFRPARDAHELRDAHIAFRDAFVDKAHPHGWGYRQNAVYTGENLMHQPWRYGQRRRRLPDMNDTSLPALVGLDGEPQQAAQIEVPYGAWARPADGPEPSGILPYVRAFDVNGQRLAACGRLKLPIGGLQHRPGPDGLDGETPGYHLVSDVADPFPGIIPPIFEPGWHTTPRVQMAVTLGLQPVVRESWVWTESIAYLNPWYEAMRDARRTLLQLQRAFPREHDQRVAAIALAALKQCYLQPLGRLRSTRAREANSPYYRPAWYDAIIGQELAREYLRLHSIASVAEHTGERVLAVYYDTVICEVARVEHVPAALTVSTQLGKYKPVGSWLPRATAYAALHEGERSPDVARLIRALKDAPRPSTVEAGPAPQPPSESAGPAPSAFTRPVHGGYPGR
jgi:hypothetical protein